MKKFTWIKIKKKYRIGCCILMVIVLVLYILPPLFFILSMTFVGNEKSKYPSAGKDTITVLGDGRFQIDEGFYTRSLYDAKSEESIVYDIEQYVIKSPFIYVIGYYSDGYPPVSYLSLKDGEIYFYEDQGILLTEVPSYLILNYETAELRTYVHWKDVSLADKTIFNTPLKECRNWRKQDCWEKSLPKKD